MSAVTYTNARAGPLADNIRQVLAALSGYTLPAEMESQAKVLSSRLVSSLRRGCPRLVLTLVQHTLWKMEGERAVIEFVDATVPLLAPFASQSWSGWDRGMFLDAYAPSACCKALDAVADARRALAADPEDAVLESDLEVALLALGQVTGGACEVKEESVVASGSGVGGVTTQAVSHSSHAGEFLSLFPRIDVRHFSCLLRCSEPMVVDLSQTQATMPESRQSSVREMSSPAPRASPSLPVPASDSSLSVHAGPSEPRAARARTPLPSLPGDFDLRRPCTMTPAPAPVLAAPVLAPRTATPATAPAAPVHFPRMEAARQPSWVKGKAPQRRTPPAGEDELEDEAGLSVKDPEDLALEARKSARFKALDTSAERLSHVDYGLPTEREYEVTVSEQVKVVKARRSVWSNPWSRTKIQYVKRPIPGSQCNYCLDHPTLKDGSPGQCNWAFCVAKCVRCWAASRGCYWDNVSHSGATGESLLVFTVRGSLSTFFWL